MAREPSTDPTDDLAALEAARAHAHAALLHLPQSCRGQISAAEWLIEAIDLRIARLREQAKASV